MTPRTRDLRSECEALLDEHRALDHCAAIEGRRHEGHQADLRLVFPDRSWLQSPSGNSLIEALQEHPKTESASRRKSTIHVRFDDLVLADLERCLAAGEPAGMSAGDIAAGQRVTVSYLGPNTNKALHVGHLRNVLIGEALSSAFTSAGAVVRRHNMVGDVGRRVGEAMAGYRSFHEGQTPADAGLAGDRFVELCCGEYSRERVRPDDADPNAEERKPLGDLADSLMSEWLREATPERELWGQLRGWVLEGHRDTLARLGVRMDHADFESAAIPLAKAMMEEGLERGILEREETGAVVYRTDKSEYPTLVLVREDGFPTEHARLLGAYDRILDELEPGEPYMEVCGVEWEPSITVLCELHERLRPGPRSDTHVRVYHASVTAADGEKIGSSLGNVLWIDDFLDDMAAGPGVTALEGLGGGAVSREDLADILLRGTFLCAPVNHSLAFAPQALLEGQPGSGRTIAEAWCLAQQAQEPNGESVPVARTAVMHSQQYRRALRRTIEKHDVTSLSRYLLSLSEACLAAPSPGPAAAPVMTRVLNSLGFLAGGREPIRDEAGAGGARQEAARESRSQEFQSI
jgi:tRNA synthetases class I (R)